jgi:hypothetical protein
MREAAHGIATLLLLTGCLGIVWMAFHAYLTLARAVQGTNRLEAARAVATVQVSSDSHRPHKQAPFVLMPE